MEPGTQPDTEWTKEFENMYGENRVGSKESGVWREESGVRSRESGVRSRESGVRSISHSAFVDSGEDFRTIEINNFAMANHEHIKFHILRRLAELGVWQTITT